MNTLACRRSDDNGLSFELLVDGTPLGELVGARDNSIPYWIIQDDLPHFPPQGECNDPQIRIVTVCSCGEYGCGHTRCRVLREADTVVLCDFDMDCTLDGRCQRFEFSKENFENVVEEIVCSAKAYRKRSEGGGELRCGS